MSAFVLSNLIVTGGMLTPGLGVGNGLCAPRAMLKPSDCRNARLAGRKPVAQRRYQLLERKQIDPTGYVDHCQVVLCCRERILRCSTRAQCHCSSIEAPLSECENDRWPPRAICCCRKRWCFERVPDARGGDPAGHQCVPGAYG